MDVKPGDVVVLKSGGPALTIAEVNDDRADCVWLSDEGHLFRETLPLVVLERAELDASEGEDHDREDDEDADDEGENEEHDDERDVA
jgi:uncharacterized protein YodC (DUF2158 family)